MNKIYILLLCCSFFVGCVSSRNTHKQVGYKVGQRGVKPRTPSYMEVQVVDNQEVISEKKTSNEISSSSVSSQNNKANATLSTEMVSQNTQLVLDTAYSYLGTPYKYGGTTRSGMDCSGFMIACYQVVDIQLNRSSDAIALQGDEITLTQVQKGDLLFFKTSKSREISHIGMVVEVGDTIKFIHASTSKGVIVSDLNETYWSKAFVKAKRILQ